MDKPVSLATIPLSRFHSIEMNTHRPQGAVALADRDVLAAYTEFSERSPLVVAATTTIEAARRWIRQARARLLIVVDPLETFLGVVSVADLFSGRSALVQAADGAIGKATVADIMTPKAELAGIPLAALVQAERGDLCKTLDATGQSWMLVVDVDRHTVCGLVVREALDVCHVEVLLPMVEAGAGRQGYLMPSPS